jgi:hypothetical protein
LSGRKRGRQEERCGPEKAPGECRGTGSGGQDVL